MGETHIRRRNAMMLDIRKNVFVVRVCVNKLLIVTKRQKWVHAVLSFR